MNGKTVTVQGTIVAVRETWPLQLVVQASDEGPYDVALSEQTAIGETGEPGDPGSLRPGMVVRVTGRPSADRAMVAARIDVVS